MESIIDKIDTVEANETGSFSKINSCGLLGIDAYSVEIEVNISNGLPAFILVGLPDTAVNESRERVRSAIKSSGYEFPSKKIIVNLAPADTKKAGPTYDLPIAIGILTNIEIINENNIEDLYIAGELGLSGKIRSVNGILSYVIHAKSKSAKGIIIPRENSDEASLIKGINIYPASDLIESINIINNIKTTKPITNYFKNIKNIESSYDLSDVKGQSLGKRALEIAASGKHHVLMIGTPGSGKTMLAQRLPSIIPSLSHEEKIEITQIYSVAGKLNKDTKLITEMPFRTPHHGTSTAGLIGGGSIPLPGEISLAHKGILFMDEFTEFQRQVLDSLRQALEQKEIVISRARKSCSFPCDFTLIAACNPCPCGYLGDKVKKCTCSQNTIRHYLTKISGPIIDRIDLQIEVKRLNETEITNVQASVSSRTIRQKVINAREIQKHRYKNLGILFNSELSVKEIKQYCTLSKSTEKLIKDAIRTLGLTARSYDRVLKVSRTIADLENSDIIKDEHLLEALQLRLSSFGNF